MTDEPTAQNRDDFNASKKYKYPAKHAAVRQAFRIPVRLFE